MIDDWLLSLIYAAWLAASTMPLGFMLGSSCSPCCGGCGVADGKPRTDPKDEGTWMPSGTWRGVGGVTWSFTANPGDESGETWFFYGSASTSRIGGNASIAERQDWYNICNWYSNKTTSPSTTSGLPTAFDKRATRLPPANAVVHIYTTVTTSSQGAATVKTAYGWSGALTGATLHLSGSEITTTQAAHDASGGFLFFGPVDTQRFDNFGTVHGGGTFAKWARNWGTINNGAQFFSSTQNFGTVNDGAEFDGANANNAGGIVNGGATFSGTTSFFSRNFNYGTINGGAVFDDYGLNDDTPTVGVVNGGATFNDNSGNGGTVNDGSTFNNSSVNDGTGTVNDGSTFNNSSVNNGTVNDGSTFNDSSRNGIFGTVNGGATFNGAACSTRTTGDFFATPCTRKFVAHPTDLPTCNGTAPNGCFTPQATCGCG